MALTGEPGVAAALDSGVRADRRAAALACRRRPTFRRGVTDLTGRPKDDVTALHARDELASTPTPGRSGALAVVGQYVALTKPRIIETLLITTIPVMILATRGMPPFWLVVATVVGGTLSAGGANTLNCVIDRDIDAVMQRTSTRPLVTGAISPRAATVFGLALAVVSVLWFGLLVNWLSAALSLGALVFYVAVYTMLLKRRTAQNIVWGGAAGCMPVLIGWAAATGTVAWPAVVLFLVLGGVIVPRATLSGGLAAGAGLLPSAALADGLRAAYLDGSLAVGAVGVLLAWGVGATVVASRTFRWSD